MCIMLYEKTNSLKIEFSNWNKAGVSLFRGRQKYDVDVVFVFKIQQN